MKKLILLTAITLCCTMSYSQNQKPKVSFQKNAVEVKRSKSTDVTFPVPIIYSHGSGRDTAGMVITVSVVPGKSDLATTAYSVDFADRPLNSLNASDATKNQVYVKLNRDSIPDRARQLVLRFDINKNNRTVANDDFESENREIVLNIPAIKEDSISGYSYLAYIGTNFDLIDGGKAAQIFFAVNVFLPPLKKKAVGYYLSLYGNRTMSIMDSVGDLRRTTKYVSLTDTSYMSYSMQMSRISSIQSDNLGAYSSPLIRLGNISNIENRIKVFLAPTLEFVWRRTKLETRYTNGKHLDSIMEKGSIRGIMEFSDVQEYRFNEYNFNSGLGLMVVHESDNISVRVHVSAGYGIIYTPLKDNKSTEPIMTYRKARDVFFTGRAWISEATTGLTLQAEIFNSMINPRPFYGVTLSKALNFKSLGTIFQPITKR